VDFLYEFPFKSHWSYQVVQKYYDHILFKGFSEKTSKVVFELINSSNIIDNLKCFINNYIMSQTTWEEFFEKLSTFNCNISISWNFFLKNFIFDYIIDSSYKFIIDFWRSISGFFFDYAWLTAQIRESSSIIRQIYIYEYIAFSILIVYITIYIVVFINIFFREKLVVVDYIFLMLITILMKYVFYYFYIAILVKYHSLLACALYISFFIFWLIIAPNYIFDISVEYDYPAGKYFNTFTEKNPKIRSFKVTFMGQTFEDLVFYFVFFTILFFGLYLYKKFSL
jgi:hypothetical protein